MEQVQNNLQKIETDLSTTKQSFLTKIFWQKHWWKIVIPFIVLIICGILIATLTPRPRPLTKTFSGHIKQTNKQVTEEKKCPTATATGCTKDTKNYSDPIKAGKALSKDQCTGEGVPYKLGHSPMDEKDFTHILPYGIMVGGHVTPIDHQYFAPKDYNSPVDAYPVYAMANSTIVSIETRKNLVLPATEYRIHFAITCTFLYYYDLVTSLSPDILQKYNEALKGQSSINIPVEEGQLIGRIGGRTLDFAVWDTTKPLSGFVVPEHYSEDWKIYTADPLNYYTDGLKKFLLSRYVRTVEPISGKIDYDIDGKLIGNWFLEGTGGYSSGGMKNDYFMGHLSFSPDHLDPSRFIVSIGSLYQQGQDESQMQHMTSPNSMNPKDVGVETGLVKYNLFRWSYQKPDGSMWDYKSLTTGLKVNTMGREQFGSVLVQLLAPRKLKFEVFQGKTAEQVTGFTQKATTYER